MEIFLARWLGLYLAIMGIFVLAKRSSLVKILEEMKKNHLFAFLTGSLRLFIGLFILMSKPAWHSDWSVIINIIAILTLLSGLFRLFAENAFMKLLGKIRGVSLTYIGIIFLIVGLFLTYKGFFFFD